MAGSSSGEACQIHELPQLHRDPFDRILVAQAACHGLAIVTDDPLDIAWVSTKPGVLLIETISGLSENTLWDQKGFHNYRASVGRLPEGVRLESVGDTLSFELKFKQRVSFNDGDAYRLGIVDSGGAGCFFRIGSGTEQAIAIVRDDGTGVALSGISGPAATPGRSTGSRPPHRRV